MKSKFFRVAVSGNTVDGRIIEPQWLKDAAELYDPTLYNARIFPEHIRGVSPNSDFKVQGDVIALKAQDEVINGKNRTALYAQIEPLPSLVEMAKRKEKLYTSIEILPEFDGSDKFYLGGLAVTDSPASLATERLSFAIKHLNMFVTDGLETCIDFEEEDNEDNQPSAFAKFTQGVRNTLAKFKKSSDTQVVELAALVGNVTKTLGEEIEQQATQYSELSKQVQELGEQLAGKNLEFADLQKKYQHLDTTDANPQQRPPATGGNGFALTTC